MKRSFQNGSPEQFKNALVNRIDELSGEVESATNIGNVGIVPDVSDLDDIESAVDVDESYLADLVDDICTSLPDYRIESDIADDCLYLTVRGNGIGIVEFCIPYEDLHFDDLEVDTNYILDAIDEEVENHRDSSLGLNEEY